MHLLDARGSFADRSGDPFHTAAANITDSEYSGHIGLEELRLARVQPSRRRQVFAAQISARADEAFVIERNAGVQPLRTRQRAGHQKHVLNVVHLGNIPWRSLPGYPAKLLLAFERRNFGLHAQTDVRRLFNAPDEILRHAVRQTL